MRRGLAALVARFEPSRYASLDRLMETFGARETLAELHIHEPGLTVVPLPPPSPGTQAVH
jgi:hypothetical protein